jgi:predicted double-glycine peptidase
MVARGLEMVARLVGKEGGADPDGLQVDSRTDSSSDHLRHHLDQGHPVMVGIQAFGKRTKRVQTDYPNDWADGHWVAAIGYDDGGVFLEDPSHQAPRGYLTQAELLERWHDAVERGAREYRRSIALWMNRPGSFSETYAMGIPRGSIERISPSPRARKGGR